MQTVCVDMSSVYKGQDGGTAAGIGVANKITGLEAKPLILDYLDKQIHSFDQKADMSFEVVNPLILFILIKD